MQPRMKLERVYVGAGCHSVFVYLSQHFKIPVDSMRRQFGEYQVWGARKVFRCLYNMSKLVNFATYATV